MRFLQYLLLPFSFIYGSITGFRNHLYNIAYKRTTRFTLPVISVGNLTVGGTGKTPHVEYIANYLKKQYHIAILSRGYGRKTKGFILADEQATAATIGDEPMQFYRKFGNELIVAVGEERALAIPIILYEKPTTQVIILDDAYQHRRVSPSFQILLTDFNRLFYNDNLLPAGRLRESARGANRADVIIVTKCPIDLPLAQRATIRSRIAKYAREGTPVFFDSIVYKQPVALPGTKPVTGFSKVVLISGLANPKPLDAYVAANYQLLHHFIFPDHYAYKPADIAKILKHIQQAGWNDCVLLTTEKDMVKLLDAPIMRLLKDLPVYYLPIGIAFLDGQAEFDALISKAISENEQNWADTL